MRTLLKRAICRLPGIRDLIAKIDANQAQCTHADEELREKIEANKREIARLNEVLRGVLEGHDKQFFFLRKELERAGIKIDVFALEIERVALLNDNTSVRLAAFENLYRNTATTTWRDPKAGASASDELLP